MASSSKAPPARAPTIMDVARAAEVSKSTVSLVLQGSALVRAETAQRVRDAAQVLGYVYNRRAAALRSHASNMVGVLINDLMNPFFAEVLVALEQRLVEAGYVVMMAHTQEDPARQRRLLASMREHHAAGIVLCPALGTPRSLPGEIESWGIPLVVLVRSLGPGRYDFAGSANEQGVQLATQHLLAAGHRRIAFLGGRSGAVFDERLRGYRKALEQAGIEVDPTLVVASDLTRAGGREAMSTVLSRRPRVTAGVCYNDVTAFGALTTLGERGLRAGKDFALLGFDNVLDAAHSNPPLSTVDIRPAVLGEQAALALIARLADGARPRQVYRGEPSLVLRQSG